MRALEFGDYDELMTAHPEALNKIAPLPEPTTDPSLLINARESALAEDFRQRFL